MYQQVAPIEIYVKQNNNNNNNNNNKNNTTITTTKYLQSTNNHIIIYVASNVSADSTHLLQTGRGRKGAWRQGQVVGRGRESLQLRHPRWRGRGAAGGPLVLQHVQDQGDVLPHLPLQPGQLPVNRTMS